MAQKPQLALLDEPESGVDLVNIALIGELINELLEKTAQCMTENGWAYHHPYWSYPGLCQRLTLAMLCVMGYQL